MILEKVYIVRASLGGRKDADVWVVSRVVTFSWRVVNWFAMALTLSHSSSPVLRKTKLVGVWWYNVSRGVGFRADISYPKSGAEFQTSHAMIGHWQRASGDVSAARGTVSKRQ